MLVKPAEFGMIQQQNTVSQIRHEEDAKPMAEQQTMVVQSQKEAEFIRMIQIIVRRSLMPRIKVIMNISLDTRRKEKRLLMEK